MLGLDTSLEVVHLRKTRHDLYEKKNFLRTH